MKKGLKGFIAGVIFTALFTSSVALAGGVNQTIQVVFNSVNIAVNGQGVTADNILYNGTTYVPLRKVAEMFGKDVGWDGNTNTANINDKGTTTITNTTPTAPAVGYSRNNPAPIGVMQRVTVADYINNYTAEVTVIETIRGNGAWTRIKEANMYNDEPKSDEEYILAKIHVKAVTIAGDKKLSIHPMNFDVYNEGNTMYDYTSVVIPEPSLVTDLFSGAEHTGYAVYKVKKADINPKIVYGDKYDGTGGIWFKLQ